MDTFVTKIINLLSYEKLVTGMKISNWNVFPVDRREYCIDFGECRLFDNTSTCMPYCDVWKFFILNFHVADTLSLPSSIFLAPCCRSGRLQPHTNAWIQSLALAVAAALNE